MEKILNEAKEQAETMTPDNSSPTMIYNMSQNVVDDSGEKKTYKEIAIELWRLLDSIDSLPDMIHPSTLEGHKKTWVMMVNRAEKRHTLLKSDGYTLKR
jgi:hypothetical protein